MKIDLHSHLKRSNRVLARIRKGIADLKVDSKDCEVRLQGYENGRESGFFLSLHFYGEMMTGPDVAFACAEHRKSDSMVVYEGPPVGGFEMAGRVPSEEVFEAAQYYNGSTLADGENMAADWITERIKAVVAERAKVAV